MAVVQQRCGRKPTTLKSMWLLQRLDLTGRISLAFDACVRNFDRLANWLAFRRQSGAKVVKGQKLGVRC